jgi:hypothetical protein
MIETSTPPLPSRPAPRDAARSSVACAVVTLGLAVLLATATLGCRGALFSESQPRTQYDQYDRSRNNYVPMYVEDEFGVKRPNLSGRLSNQS